MPIADRLLDRILAFLLRSLELTADELRRIDAGWVTRTPSLPLVWNLNQVRITRALTTTEVAALADAHLVGVPYDQLTIEDDAGARRLAEAYRAEGWRVERDLLMALTDRLQRSEPTGKVLEPDEEQMLALMRRWIVEELHPHSDEVDQLVQAARREGRAWRERRLGILGDDGRLAAITKLRSDGAVAQVEDVYTAPESRRRGFARSLVRHASELALASGHDLVFIIADEDNWPKCLYARLGFAPVGRIWNLHRDAG